MLRSLPFALVLMVAGRLPAAEFPTPFDSEAAPGDPMAAEEVAAKWEVPDGFKVRVFASEPEVRNPIACAWDARGRLWIAENYTYAESRLQWENRLRDRVVIFEDLDGDGRQDKRTVFTDEVRHLTSVEVGRGGVWLMCPPQLLFIPDKDRDDRPDGAAEVVLDGFNVPAQSHHNFANGLRWGPDGWLYGRCGASAPGMVGVPGTGDAGRIPLVGGLWRYHPERKVFEAICHGTTNPWGHDWNEAGEVFFTNTVNGQLWQAIPGAHFERSHTIDPNPCVYELMEQTADHYHFDTGKGWTASRDGAANSFGGGHAHCGAMIYLGDNWPDSYRGKLYTLNFHGRRMNVERIEREGSGYVGKHDGDLFRCPDPFFRGIDLTYGPDGGVYVLDWSDTGECHENTGVHRSSGRIYKISQGETKRPEGMDLAKLSNGELVKLHGHKNEWFVRMARRELTDRAVAGRGEGLGDALRLALKDEREGAAKLRILATAFATGNADFDFLTRQLRDRDEAIRAWAVQRLADHWPIDRADGVIRTGGRGHDVDFEKQAVRLAREDPSALVRMAVASTLGRCALSSRGVIAKGLVGRGEDADDRDLSCMIWYGIEPLFAENGGVGGDIFAVAEMPLLRRMIARRIAADSERNPAGLERLVSSQEVAGPAIKADLLDGLIEGFTGWRKAAKPGSWDAFVAKVGESKDPSLIPKTRELSVLFGDGRALDDVRKIALNGKASLDARKAALRSLIEARPDDLRGICEKLLDVRFLNTVAVRGLAQFDDPLIGTRLASRYAKFHPSERAAVIETLSARPAFAGALLGAMAQGIIPREDVSAFHARQIRGFGDEVLTKQLGEVWGEIRDSVKEKRDRIAGFKSQLTPAALGRAELSHGRVLYEQLCATCHMLYGSGGRIGPDLTGSGRADLDYLLENIVDPGAVVSADFRLHVLTMKDGRVLNGMITAKNGRTLTLRTMTETVTVERGEIASQAVLPQSLMPEGLLQALDETQVRNLIAYLMAPAQVPLAGEEGD